MRYLAVDLGDRRTGLAAGDDVTGIVTPLEVVEVPAGERLIDAIARRIEAHHPDAVVIGLPLNMDGTEGERAKTARRFGAALAERCSVSVRYQDERLTSYAADGRMAGSGRTHKQKRQIRDALAAAEILGDYIGGTEKGRRG